MNRLLDSHGIAQVKVSAIRRQQLCILILRTAKIRRHYVFKHDLKPVARAAQSESSSRRASANHSNGTHSKVLLRAVYHLLCR